MKRFQVVFTELAEQDLDGIIDYIAQDSVARAITYVESLRDRAIATLATVPDGGVDFYGAQFFPFDDYIIVYDVDEANETVIIHMVVHGSRQWKALFVNRF